MKLRNHLLRFGVILLILCLVTACTPGTRPPVGDCSHTDVDDNGHCDDCGLSVIVLLDLYAINDLHGKFADTDEQPGVDELTTYLKGESTKHDNTIFLSSGDMWQGGAESNITKGQIIRIFF